jgi:hypothetical protein
MFIKDQKKLSNLGYSGGNYVFNGDFNKITMWDSGAYKNKINEYANEL